METNPLANLAFKRSLFFLLFLIFLIPQTGYSQNNNLRYEILLNNEMLKDSSLTGSLSASIDVSHKHLITISNGNQLYLLGWGGVTPFADRSLKNIEGFTYTSDGLLLAVRSGELCYINEDGSWEGLIKLPNANMSIASGSEVVYLYDKAQSTGKYNTYALAKSGRYKRLFSTPKPVSGIGELGDSIYVSIENGIYSFSPLKNKLTLFLALEKGIAINSLAFDPLNGVIYFSTQTSIFATRKNTVVTLTREFPGSVVKYFGNGLLIFNPQSKNILRIVNIESSIEF